MSDYISYEGVSKSRSKSRSKSKSKSKSKSESKSEYSTDSGFGFTSDEEEGSILSRVSNDMEADDMEADDVEADDVESVIINEPSPFMDIDDNVKEKKKKIYNGAAADALQQFLKGL